MRVKPAYPGSCPVVTAHALRVTVAGMPLEFPEISPRGADPPFAQIAAFLEDAIRSGDLQPDDVLPSETEIMQATGVGRSTVRRAMARLRERGLVRTVKTRGTYVSRDAPPE
jgi:GntR family transcriptional regulator